MTYAISNVNVDWLLGRLWPKDAPANRAVWAVLDGARDRRIYDLVRYSRMERSCLYAGQHPEELLSAAPHLIRLSEATLVAREILSAAWGQSWGILLSTTASLDKLRLHLRGFLRVRDARGRKLVFRYYDPRVFRQYVPTCTTSELETIFGPIDTFMCEARDGSSLLRFGRDHGRLTTDTVQMPAFATSDATTSAAR